MDFPGLSPAAWDAAAKSIARTAARDVEQLVGSTGRRGAEARMRALVTSMQQLFGLSTDEAWTAARAVGSTTSMLRSALDDVLAAVPDETIKAMAGSAEWLARGGAPIVLSEATFTSIVGRTTAGITADWTRLAAASQEGIVATLRQAVLSGSGATDAATAMFKGTYGQVGLTHARAVTIARTELGDAYQAANLTQYAQAGVQYYEWFANDGPRTCAMCLALNGTVFPITEAPANHHNCRCEMLPVFDNELRRVGSDGRMPGTKVPNATIQARLPSTWTVPKDPRDLIGTRDVPGWRSVKVLVKP